MKEWYDVIIVGGGIGGLTTANYLAKAGLKTVILEQHYQIGGYVTSFPRKDYIFEGGLTSFGSNGIVFPILQELELGHKVQFSPVKRRLVTDKFEARVDMSFADLRRALLQTYPEEQVGINRYFDWADAFADGMQELIQMQLFMGKPVGKLRDILTYPVRNLRFLASVVRNLNTTKADLHHKYFRNTELVEILDTQGYPMMTGNTLGGMWYSFKSDYWYPLGGMQQFSNLLLENFRQLGGEAYLREKVEKILVDNARITGVRLAGGKVIHASAVLSNVDLRTTYLELLGEEHVNPAFLTPLRQGEPSESMFTVFLGLKGKGFPASPYTIDASHLYFYLKTGDGKINEFAVNIPSIEDPSLASSGETVIVSCFEEYSEWEPLIDRGAAYRKKKAERTQQVLQMIRQIFPDIEERLEVIEAATPLTYEHYTGNYKGATAGWSWNPRLRPRLDWKKGSIPGLYLASHWIMNPGGVPSAMMTGRTAAQNIIKEQSSSR